MNQTLESHQSQDSFITDFNLFQSLLLWGSKAHFIVETMLHIGILKFKFLADYLIGPVGNGQKVTT